jgi:hypothetical protein
LYTFKSHISVLCVLSEHNIVENQQSDPKADNKSKMSATLT